MESKKFINANDLKCSVLNTGLQREDNYEIFSNDK